ncbi:hypothetical protein [Chroococcidiopsis sp. CCNUC1]|nr:hypothetical protein [Chroococcidiopsis sp. CCNUC1]URD51865.1 hypothetical protein M5J74_07695 [Chroococcidiopsis sp. CCNUC1]
MRIDKHAGVGSREEESGRGGQGGQGDKGDKGDKGELGDPTTEGSGD